MHGPFRPFQLTRAPVGGSLHRCLPSWLPLAHRRRARLVTFAEQCLYETLGVPRTASKADLKQAYRRLARIHHPDVNPVSFSPKRFQAISMAYEVLIDDEKRLAYDRYGLAGLGSKYGSSQTAPGARRAGGRGAEVGEDVQVTVGITLQEAALGGERDVVVLVRASCPDCGGSGGAAGAAVHTCELCRGQGVFLKSRRPSSFGMHVALPSTCPACAGRGVHLTEPCPCCEGHGMRRQRRSVRVRIPPGADESSVLRVKGRGDESMGGGPTGDVQVRFELEPHSRMRREGMDLHSYLALPLWDAILGGPAAVETVRGVTTIQVPPGTQHGSTLSLPRQGLPRLGGPSAATGAHHFKVRITLPAAESIGEAERELLEQLRQQQERRRARQGQRGQEVQGAGEQRARKGPGLANGHDSTAAAAAKVAAAGAAAAAAAGTATADKAGKEEDEVVRETRGGSRRSQRHKRLSWQPRTDGESGSSAQQAQAQGGPSPGAGQQAAAGAASAAEQEQPGEQGEGSSSAGQGQARRQRHRTRLGSSGQRLRYSPAVHVEIVDEGFDSQWLLERMRRLQREQDEGMHD